MKLDAKTELKTQCAIYRNALNQAAGVLNRIRDDATTKVRVRRSEGDLPVFGRDIEVDLFNVIQLIESALSRKTVYEQGE